MSPTVRNRRHVGIVAAIWIALSALSFVLGFPTLGVRLVTMGLFILLLLAVIFGVVLPAIEATGDDTVRSPSMAELSQPPIEQLRGRYARGEVTDEEFDHRLERLQETAHIAESEQHTGGEMG